MNNSVFLDTNFLIAWQKTTHVFHTQAQNYFKYCLDNSIVMKVSTIALAEYAVHGNFARELPIQNFQIISFLPIHSQKSGEFTNTILRNRGQYQQLTRQIIPNDVKLITQANCDPSITHFVTTDINSITSYQNILSVNGIVLGFTFFDLRTFQLPESAQAVLELDN